MTDVREFDPEVLVTERLRLCPLRPDDADEMAGVLGDERLHEFIGGRPFALAELRSRYERLAVGRSPDGSQRWLDWIVRMRVGDAAVGTVQATIETHEGRAHASVAWVVGVAWQRRGFGGEAAWALVEWLERRGADAIVAHVRADHAASAGVAARAGLVQTDETVDGERVWRRASAPRSGAADVDSRPRPRAR